LATPYFVRRFSSPLAAKPPDPPIDKRPWLAMASISMKSLTRRASTFVHQAPVLDSKLAAIMPEVTSMGASVSIVDFDRDGWPDIYVTNSSIGSKNHLYRNNHDGTFTDVADQMGVADVNQAWYRRLDGRRLGRLRQ
jgi:hypothetical protein